MTREEAEVFEMPMGQHIGQSLREIAESDRGLTYLDYMRGQDYIKKYDGVKEAIDALFTYEPYKSDLDRALEE
jgi:hypothetical protein